MASQITLQNDGGIRKSEGTPDMIEADSLSSVSTSATFRFHLTCAMASKFYSEKHAAIQAEHDFLLPIKNEFKEQSRIAPKLQDLALATHEMLLDVENALEFQKKRDEILWNEEKEIIGEYGRVIRDLKDGVLISGDWDPEIGYWKDLGIRGTFYHWIETDHSILEQQKEDIVALEMADNERESHLRRSILQSKMATHITEAQLRRFNAFRKKTATKVLESEYESEEQRSAEWKESMRIYRLRVAEVLDKLPGLSDKYDRIYEIYINKRSDIMQEKLNAYHKIGSFRKWMICFKNLEKKIRSDANFAQSLQFWDGPLRFLDFPREIRDLVYNSFLLFNCNISEKRLACKLDTCPYCLGQYYTGSVWDAEDYWRRFWKGRRSIIWTHPLFHVSRQIRQESTEQFFQQNSFAARTLSTLWTPNLPPNFRELITSLSLTWPSLDETSIKARKALESFKGLRFLKIYLNWDQLRSRPRNTMGGLEAFEFVLENLDAKVNSLQKVEVFDVRLQGRELDMLREIRNEFESSTYRTIFSPHDSEDDNGFLPQRPIYQTPVRAHRLELSPYAKRLEEVFDRLLSSRILHARSPDTIYSNNRQPRKPTSVLETLDTKKALQAQRRGIIYTPAVAPLEKSVVRERLEEIRADLVKQRVENKAIVAAQAVVHELEDAMFTALPDDEPSDTNANSVDGINTESAPETSNSEAENESIAINTASAVDIRNLQNFWGSFNNYFSD